MRPLALVRVGVPVVLPLIIFLTYQKKHIIKKEMVTKTKKEIINYVTLI